MRLSRWLPWVMTAAFAAPALARIKLITLPVRERVEIQLDHESATLVEEERIVPLVKGENQVDFSWANTQIDPNTIVFRVVGPHPERTGRHRNHPRQPGRVIEHLTVVERLADHASRSFRARYRWTCQIGTSR